MSASIFSIIAILFTACVAPASVHASMQDDVDQAVTIIERFQQIPEKAIPTAVLREAKGLAILTVTKAGFIVSGRGGTGVVVARTEKGWSGPSAVGTGGVGFAFKLELRSPSLSLYSTLRKLLMHSRKEATLRLGAV